MNQDISTPEPHDPALAPVPAATASGSEVLYCTVHPTVETTLRCNKCGRPMCAKCAVRTPVGYRCRECVKGQQALFYNAQTLDPVIQGVISLVAGAIVTPLTGLLDFGLGFISWLIAFWIGSVVGAFIADIAHRAAGKRRSRYGWLVVAGAIVLGGLGSALFFGLSLTKIIFLVMAVSGAVGRLKLGR
jgi:hypothetical protein